MALGAIPSNSGSLLISSMFLQKHFTYLGFSFLICKMEHRLYHTEEL